MTWPRFGDLVINYAVLTPLCVTYWFATFKLLDDWTGNNLTKALITGFVIVVLSILLSEVLRCTSDSFEMKCIYEFLFDYVIFTSCLSYSHGCKVLYEQLKTSLGLSAPAVAGIVGSLLMFVRGYRNVLALPMVVNNDKLVDRYRPVSTLKFFNGCTVNDIFLICTLWPSIALYWEGVSEFLNGLGLQKHQMCLYGYVAMVALHTIIKEVLEKLLEDFVAAGCGDLTKILIEDIFIAAASVSVILIWCGWNQYAETVVQTIGSYLAPVPDVLATQLITFTLFCLFGVSMSLFSRSNGLDGDGVHFNTVIFC